MNEIELTSGQLKDFSQRIIDDLWKHPLRFKEHEIWLKEFLKNAKQMNKSAHTLISYRADLIKFLRWYERQYEKAIIYTDAESIGHYQAYLSGELLRPPKQSARPSAWNFFKIIKNLWPKSKEKKQNTLSITEDKSEHLQLPPRSFSMSSKKRHISSIKNFFEFLKQTHEGLPGKRGQLFLHNPVKNKLHSIKLKDVDIEHTPMLLKHEWEELELKATRSQERAMIFLLYYGGIRLSELAQIRWQDLHYSQKAISLIRKGGDRHTLRLRHGELVFREIRRFSESLSRVGIVPENEAPLFSGKKSRPMTERGLAKMIKALFKRTGLRSEISPHSFRKACATEMYLETRDLLAVRDYLNHSDAKVTQTYIDKLALETDRHVLQ